MKFIDKVKSSVDEVVKYTFEIRNGQIVEFSYIDSGTGKDIICVSCQTMCNIGCKFCHTTDYIGKLKVYSLEDRDILDGVLYIVEDRKPKYETLLISYMGCGEPFNVLFENHIINSMHYIWRALKDTYKTVRFGLATCLPRTRVGRFFKFCSDIEDAPFDVKLHLSLHYTDDEIRKVWMPSSLAIRPSIALCKFYKEYTGNNVEIHYTLIDGVNDTDEDIYRLNSLLMNTGFNLKFITYNEKETLDNKASSRIDSFRDKIRVPYEYFSANGQDVGSACGMYLLNAFKDSLDITTETYTPPGRDVGASCGQFLLDQYVKYGDTNGNKTN